MERNNYNKALILKLYLKAIINTPYAYNSDKRTYFAHRNTLNALRKILLNKDNHSPAFVYTDEEIIASNIKTFDAYKDFNDLLLNINTDEIDYYQLLYELKDLLNQQAKEEDITYDEMLEHTYNYYNSIPDNEIRNVFNKIYKEKDKNIRLQKKSSTYLFPTIDYSLITLNKTKGLGYKNVLFDLIHEYGHAIQGSINPIISIYSNNYEPAELMPVFFNILSLFYFDNTSATLIEKNVILQEASQFLTITKNTKEIKDNGLEAFKANHNEWDYSFYKEYSQSQIYRYLIPILVSFELLPRYKEDPEKALNLLKKLINNNMDYIDILKFNKINLGENTNEAIKMLKK